MEAAEKYKTLEGTGTSLFRDRGSKFLGFSFPVSSKEEIKTHLQALRKEHPKANHHVYAWRLGTDGNSYRAVDDGEPSGSSGKPVLGQIDSAELTNVLVIVVRYFGGSLLGVPGLINAYKTAAQTALAEVPVVEKWIEQRYLLEFDYPSMGEVLHLLNQHHSTIYKQDLQLFCRLDVGIPLAHVALIVAFVTALKNGKTTLMQDS